MLMSTENSLHALKSNTAGHDPRKNPTLRVSRVGLNHFVDSGNQEFLRTPVKEGLLGIRIYLER